MGKHKIIVSAYGKKLTKTIYIKKGKYRISASGATVKKGKSKYIEIEIMDNSYNSIKNKKVTVKVSGKTYKLKTLKHCWKKLSRTQINEKIFCVHE